MPLRPRQELASLVRLAIPVVIAELGWVAMGVVDTMMVGRVGDAAIGAVGVGRALFLGVGVFGIGLLLGLDTVISNAFGAGKLERCRRALWHGVLLAVAISIPLTALIRGLALKFGAWGVDPTVLDLAVAYTRMIGWSALPIFLYAALRRYLQAMGRVLPVMLVLLSANAINIFVNWVLIFGNLGAPRMGVRGAAWATVLSAWYMALLLAVLAIRHASGLKLSTRFRWAIDPTLLRRLLQLGVPAALQLLFEVGVFCLSTLLAGRLAPAALAAHQIAMNVASTTYMVPLGISQATAVRVGHQLGAGDRASARRVGWMGIGLSAAFMACSALMFVLFPRAVMSLWGVSSAVLTIGVPLFAAAAVFQLFDGLQVSAIGALRGAGDTRSAMAWNLFGYWGIALPLGYQLCFRFEMGALGLWIGFCAGLIVCGLALVRQWAKVSVSARAVLD